jgi:hypothetical protein
MSTPKVFTIINGPSRWNMMLAVFHGEYVDLKIEEKEGDYLESRAIYVNGGYFNRSPGKSDDDIFSFEATLPVDWTTHYQVKVAGKIDLRTRKGKLENPAWVAAGCPRASEEELALS